MTSFLTQLAAWIALIMVIVMGFCMIDVVYRMRQLAATEKKILAAMMELLQEMRRTKGPVK